MIITVEQLSKYSNVFSDNSELQEIYIKASTDLINTFLGYNIEEKILNPNTLEFEIINSIDDIPNIILSTVLRISTILQSESDSNVAITSKSFGSDGSRQYMNFTNFDKYLLQISSYRLIRI